MSDKMLEGLQEVGPCFNLNCSFRDLGRCTINCASMDALRAKLEKAMEALDSICEAANREIKFVPEGYYAIQAWSNGYEIVINGEPPREEDDYDEETGHNCDAMGCSTIWHVIHRALLDGSPIKRADFSALAKQCAALAEIEKKKEE